MNTSTQDSRESQKRAIGLSNLAIIVLTVLILAGIAYFKKPELFKSGSAGNLGAKTDKNSGQARVNGAFTSNLPYTIRGQEAVQLPENLR